jgi:serine phosphatase RsbU (regulator of sigma subunit)
MNRLLHVSTDASSYATFFTRNSMSAPLLTYVNAGHNPPMLVRANRSVKLKEWDSRPERAPV